MAIVVRAAPVLRRTVGRSRAPQRPGAARSVVPAERRDRRRGHHLATRRHRRRTQLGLPLFVGPRRELHHGGPVGRGLSRRGRRLLRLPGYRGSVGHRSGRGAADHVRNRRRTRPDRARTPASGRLARQPARARRQRRLEPAADRRIRRIARGSAPSRRPTRRHRRRHQAIPDRVRRYGRGQLAGEGPGHLGGPRRSRSISSIPR